jgi:hypothetical protein
MNSGSEFLGHQEIWIIQKRLIKRWCDVAVLQLMVVVYSQAMFLRSSPMEIAALDEQRLGSAWLQVAKKHTSVMLNQTRPERNQIFPQGCGQHHGRSLIATIVPLRQIDKDLTDELEILKDQ